MSNPVLFGSHLLLERINVGGMAEVFRAKTFGVEGFERMVAIKRILPQMAEDADFIRMFIDEARIVSQLTHNNIVQIYELGREEDVFFISMEFVTGRDLRMILDRLKRQKRLMPEPMACFIISLVCEALDHAHRKKSPGGQPYKIIHRDVSPQNVLLSFEGEVKLCDFGIAKAVSQSQRTQAGVLKGKFAYMSPEQVKGQTIDHRSDLFALGVIFYELLTGQRLFLGESDFSTLEAVRSARVPSPRTYNQHLPARLERILLKMLARLPKDRYQNASQIFGDLQEYLLTSRQIYHVHHLRQFMHTQYAKEIEDENRKLKEYQNLKAPSEIERTNALGPKEVGVVSALRSHEGDLESAETGDLDVGRVAGIRKASASQVSAGFNDGVSVSEIEPSIRTDEFSASTDDDEFMTDGELTPNDNETVHGDGLANEFAADDEDQTICDDGSDEPNALQAEIQAAQVELLEQIDAQALDGVAPSKHESQVTEYHGNLIPGAVISSREASKDPRERPVAELPQESDFAAFASDQDDRPTADPFLADDDLTAGQANAAGVLRPLLEGHVLEPEIEDSNLTMDDDSEEAAFTPPERRVTGHSLPTPRLPRMNSINALGLPGNNPGPGRLEARPAISLKNPKVVIGTAFFVALIVAVGLVSIFGTGGGRAQVATLKLDSKPIKKVDIFVDGVLVGRSTPLFIPRISRGKHEIRVEATGYRSYRQSIEIVEDRPHTLDVPLTKQSKTANVPSLAQEATARDGTAETDQNPPTPPKPQAHWNLEIVSIPRGARVKINGVDEGRSPLSKRQIEQGKDLNVMFELDGYQAYTERVRSPRKAGTTLRLRAILKPVERERRPERSTPTKERISPSELQGPRGGTVAKTAGKTPSRPAVDRRRTKSVAIKRSASIDDQKSGYLMLTTIPRGLEVTIDGKPTGLKSPFRKPYRLSPGKHSVSMTGRSGKAQTFNVTISPGGTTKLVKRIR